MLDNNFLKVRLSDDKDHLKKKKKSLKSPCETLWLCDGEEMRTQMQSSRPEADEDLMIY